MIRLRHSVFLTPLLAGCFMFTSKYEGETLRKDVTTLQQKIETMEHRDADLTAATADAKEQVTKLKQILEEATRLVTRNSADFGLQVQKLQQDLATVVGRLDELAHTMDVMQKDYQTWKGQADARMETLGGSNRPGGTTTTTPTDKNSLFQQAQDKLSAGDHEEARRLLRLFLTQNPQDARAPQAQLFHGESFYQQKKYAAAIGEFQKLIDTYPKSPLAEQAMFRIGQSFFELRYCTDAKNFFADTMKKYPKSTHSTEIQHALAEIQKNSKNKKYCAN